MAAVKCFLGHSLGVASGDQVASTLGIWEDGLIPGIGTIEEPAADVFQANLQLATRHRQVDPLQLQYAIINSKGFGGNNASAALLSPDVARRMMKSRYSAQEWLAWQRANEGVRERQQAYDDAMIGGGQRPVYRFDYGVLHDEDVQLDGESITVGGRSVSLVFNSPYDDMSAGD